MAKIKNFIDLDAWREGHKLVLEIYKITNNFPNEEKFGLTSQIRRCTVSITSNIAEGFSRKTNKDKIKFYIITLGSLTELQNQIIISKDLGYITKSKYDDIYNQIIKIQKITNGLIRYLKK